MPDLDLDPFEPWTPHEHPERPFDEWTWLCDCRSCMVALVAEAAHRPRLVLCLKSSCDRVLVTAEYLAATMAGGGSAEDLLHVDGDWVREVFVPVDGRLAPPHRWWSFRLAEAETGRRRPGTRLCVERAASRKSFSTFVEPLRG